MERNYFHIDDWIRILLELSFSQYPSFFFFGFDLVIATDRREII